MNKLFFVALIVLVISSVMGIKQGEGYQPGDIAGSQGEKKNLWWEKEIAK